jgi:hypothetical protein
VLNTYYLLFLFLCFIIVVIIETNIMRKLFKTETFGELAIINLVSNGLSKLVGIPIAFLISFNLQLLALSLFGWIGFLLFPLFIILLLYIAYLFSVRIEQSVVTKFLGKKYNQETISQAVRSANKVSYLFIFIAGAIFASAYERSRSRQFQDLENRLDQETETQEVA